MDWKQNEPLIDLALAEDLGSGDVTIEALISPDLQASASIMAKDSGILAGIEVAGLIFHRVDSSLKFEAFISDGNRIEPGDVIAGIDGNVAGILKAERTALNFLQRLSGIASETRRYIEAVKGLNVRIIDTRKTTPGLRLLEKYAVRAGGGHNHRFSLGDQVLIKDNHLAILHSQRTSLKEAIAMAKQKAPSDLKVEVEVKNAEEAGQAADTGVDIIMLDNMSLAEMSRAVELIGGRASVEASGGITLDNVRQVAETGVDLISIGALTHSVKALDISLELED
ncbi:carboxylating nicotinate-nucleotide diphosphorylase [Chloroflexota bacterium]